MSAKNIPLDRLIPLHPVMYQEKCKALAENFNQELAVPILVDEFGELLNGTHRYRAFLMREKLGLKPNFTFVYMEDLKGCWVGDGLTDILNDSERWCAGHTYIDLDYFWRDNWIFSVAYSDDDVSHETKKEQDNDATCN